MSSTVEDVYQTVSFSLLNNRADSEITRARIAERVRKIADAMAVELTSSEIEEITRRLEATIQITMAIGSKLVDSSYRPWLNTANETIEWRFWERYRKYLTRERYGLNVVGQLDIITDEILDLLQNPKDEGKWQRKGLVVGQVQSGKTSNYAGVICKALDAGYKVVIVLAGMLNSLRRQTQERIDFGVIGLNSVLFMNSNLREKLVGVGEIEHIESAPVSITTVNDDFNKAGATQRQTAIRQYASPLVFVIKKNVTILQNLISWLNSNNMDLSQEAMLLIDDEADHASINTKRPDLDPAETNKKIRELLSLFSKSVYLGYTATPFANIFIDPDTETDMLSDLFPENFIKTLDPPSNYFGADRIFGTEDSGPIRVVNDHEIFLPERHRKEHRPESLPESLLEAIRVFVLNCTIREIRDHRDCHNSMMVNVTRFTGIQSHLRIKIKEYLSDVVGSIKAYHKLPFDEATSNSAMQSLYVTWQKEFLNIHSDWKEIQLTLGKAASRIEVVEVNVSTHAEKAIDYTKRNYPNGRSLIAIGGLSLSRGITLEGLSVSYFLRNSKMYDTLMQMGRWFGYRDGYEDLCRVYMTSEARGWYKYISEVTDELRADFRKMEQLQKTPKDFGLRVRNHPDSLIVTARNKMRSAKEIVREIDLTGRLIETNRLFTDKDKVDHNLMLVGNMVARLMRTGSYEHILDHRLWKGVSSDVISDFVGNFQNHPESAATDSLAVASYIDEIASEFGYNLWNVLLVSPQRAEYRENETQISIVNDDLGDVHPGIRRKCTRCPYGIMLGNRKLGQADIHKIDLYEGEDQRSVPLLMLHVLDCRLDQNGSVPVFPNGTGAFGISFPGEKAGQRIKKLATYQVNTVWMRENYGLLQETEEDMEGDL